MKPKNLSVLFIIRIVEVLFCCCDYWVTLIVVLFGAIFYFNIQFYKDKELFKIKLEILQNSIVEINNKQKSLSNQMKIIDNFDENLKKNKEVLPNALLNFNLELLIILDRNNLIK